MSALKIQWMNMLEKINTVTKVLKFLVDTYDIPSLLIHSSGEQITHLKPESTFKVGYR